MHHGLLFGYLYWGGVCHFLNLVFLTFLIRSGLEIFSSLPKLYWNDNCTPGTEWLKLTRKKMPKDRLWISLQEEESFPSWLALPGKKHLGIGRHWHFLCALFWIINGLAYVGMLFWSGEWVRLIPTSWTIFPDAGHAVVTYLHFHSPPHGQTILHPYNALQQLAYASVVFLLAPLTMATGLAMSPTIAGRFPWYIRLFGGRQAARSIHFLALISWCAFIVVHVALAVLEGFGRNMSFIVGYSDAYRPRAVLVGVTGLGLLLLLHIAVTVLSLRRPRTVQTTIGHFLDAVWKRLFGRAVSHQQYPPAEISPFLRVNGFPPATEEYRKLQEGHFEDWRLEVAGLVEAPALLSLADLQAMPQQEQTTKHNCIQGWSGVASWSGVPLSAILDRCRPAPTAQYAVFYALDEDEHGHHYYEVISLEIIRHPQTLLALTMNGQPLPVEHGAPCRLRVETQLGFKMVKWLRKIEFVEEFSAIGEGNGGYREDTKFYGTRAGI